MGERYYEKHMLIINKRVKFLVDSKKQFYIFLKKKKRDNTILRLKKRMKQIRELENIKSVTRHLNPEPYLKWKSF
jgi:hypothetical protein